jgi:hypothetical protein
MAETADGGDAALILAYAQETEIPSPLQKWYNTFDRDRRYVNNDCMILDAEDAVATNHILRNQYTLMSLINSRDADISIKPEDAMWPPQPQYLSDPMSGQQILDPMGMPVQIGELPGEVPPEIEGFARTQEILARRLLREARFRQQLSGATQDVETNAIMFVKVNQQEDLKRDPIGNYRFNDQQDNFALYQFWQKKVAAGEIAEGSAEMKRFTDLQSTIREYVVAQLQQEMLANPAMLQPQIDPMTGAPMLDEMGQPIMQPDPRQAQMQGLQDGTLPIDPASIPEVASWIGFPIDFIQPEDLRVSWDITRPEDFWRAKRIQHRVYADRDETAAKYNLSAEEAKTLPEANTSNTKVGTGEGDATKRDQTLVDKQIGKEVELWECWDRQTNRVSVYAKGFKRFFHSYTPRVVWRNWYPFIPYIFNRVTGRLVGVSSATLQRPAQEEINLMRTLDRHAKKACFPRILVRKGIFSKGEKQKYKRGMPYEIIELDTPDEINNALKETATTQYNPLLTDSARAEMDLQRMSGTSAVTGGTVGISNSATETATAQAGTDAMADYRRSIIEDLYVDVVTCMLDMAVVVMPEANIKALAGPGAIVPQVDRETLWRSMHISVRAGSTGKPDTDKRLAWMTNITQIAKNMGLMPQGPQILDELTRDAGIFTGLSKFFQMAPMAPMGGPPGAGGPATGGPPPSTPGLDSQQGQGGGGSKPMSKAPTPDSIPNRPQV